MWRGAGASAAGAVAAAALAAAAVFIAGLDCGYPSPVAAGAIM